MLVLWFDITHTYTRKHKYTHTQTHITLTQQTHQRWIDVETTLIVKLHQCCFSVDIWLKMKVEPTYIYQRFSTLTKQRWNNVDRVTLIRCWWPNVVSRLVLGWKGKLTQRMVIGYWENSIETTLSIFIELSSLESGSMIT